MQLVITFKSFFSDLMTLIMIRHWGQGIAIYQVISLPYSLKFMVRVVLFEVYMTLPIALLLDRVGP